uniref:ORF69 n=1 Tax=Nitrosopumilaceae spindle-shaped virus TaxID=3065433 RepID=A0AAT9JA94_9VIRU
MESLNTNRENKQKNREIDRILGEQYRTDQRAIGLTYTEYKKNWLESIKLKELKTHYSVFEPTPGESPYDFKKRLRSITLIVPVETKEEFEQRLRETFK